MLTLEVAHVIVAIVVVVVLIAAAALISWKMRSAHLQAVYHPENEMAVPHRSVLSSVHSDPLHSHRHTVL